MFGPEMSLTIRPLPDEGLMKMFRRLADSLQGAPILNLLIFGSSSASAPAADAMKRTFGKARWPVTWVDGGACDGSPIAGIQVSALTGGAVQPIWLAGRVVGSVFQDASARHCLLGGLGPARPSSSREDQTKQTLEQLETALAQAAFSIADTVRTWFYLDNILSWVRAIQSRAHLDLLRRQIPIRLTPGQHGHRRAKSGRNRAAPSPPAPCSH